MERILKILCSTLNMLLFFSIYSNAQNNVIDVSQVVLPSPTAAAMQRYGQYPLGNFTGSIDINLPLFEVVSGKLKVPVGLGYYSTGIKMGDVGTDLGIGWTLTGGGSVSRKMMGNQVDEHPSRGYWASFPFQQIIDSYDEYVSLIQYCDGRFDTQPDEFTYSAPGLSGKFVYDSAQNVHFLPYKKHLVEKQTDLLDLHNPLSGLTAPGPIHGFTITDENGVCYQFFDYEFSETESFTYENDDTDPVLPTLEPIRVSPSYIFTWYLTRMISADKKDTLHFEYESTDISYRIFGGSSIQAVKKTGGNLDPIFEPYTRLRARVKNKIRAKMLSKIVFDNGYLQFYHGTLRKDIEGAKALDSIVLYKNGGQKIKSYSFDYFYLVSNSLLSRLQIPINTPPEEIRMFLRSFSEIGADGTALPEYAFDYEHSLGLPSRLKGGGDIWGYANGKVYDGIGDLINSYTHHTLVSNFDESQDSLIRLKRPDFNYAVQGTLKSIQYPTGGSTVFEYEPHFKEVRTTQRTVEICDGNVDVELTGVQFAPFIPNDPDAPPPPKFRISTYSLFDVTVSLDARHSNFPLYYYVEIRDSATDALKFTYYKSSVYCDSYTSSPYPVCTKQVSLGAGTYYILAKNTGQTYQGSASDIYCKVSIPSLNCRDTSILIPDSVSVGGVRIKSVTDVDSLAGRKERKVFDYTNGVRPSQFNGIYLVDSHYYYYALMGGIGGDGWLSEWKKDLTSSSLYSLTDISQFYVCYGKVTERKIDVINGLTTGYIEYYYNNDIDDYLHEQDFNFMPYPPYAAQYWRRGMLIGKKEFKMASASPVLIREERRNYSDLKMKSRVRGEAFYAYERLHDGSEFPLMFGSPYLAQDEIRHTSYSYTSSYNLLDSITVKEYDDLSNPIVTKTKYIYDTITLLPRSVEEYNSKGGFNITEIRRPFDYSNITSSSSISEGIKQLRANHILSPEIERSVYKANSGGSGQRLISSVFKSYKSHVRLPDKLFSIEVNTPLADFSPSSVVSGIVEKDSRYKERVSFNAYGVRGNLLEQQKADDVKHSYIWDYNNGYPIASVVNAKISDIAYTSFEADGKGNWTFSGTPTVDPSSPSGEKVYPLGNSLSRSGLSTSTAYVVSYWKKGGTASVNSTTPSVGKTINGWTYYQHTVVNPAGGIITVSGSNALIDELRLYPATGQMSTYLYTPALGMSAECDINSAFQYYNYDAFGKLREVRDKDGYILKMYDYQFKVDTNP